MVISSDFILKGEEWEKAINELYRSKNNFFSKQIDLFILCLAIGIMYDERKADQEFNSNREVGQIPRSVLVSPKTNNLLDVFFQIAILSTTTLDLSDQQRMILAFKEDDNLETEDTNFSKTRFLIEYANYGVTKINPLIRNNALYSMQSLLDYLINEIRNYNIEDDIFKDLSLID